MKFKNMEYKRPDIKEVEVNFNELLEKLNNSESAEEQEKIIKKFNNLVTEIQTMMTLVEIRHTIDTTDKFYEDEQNYMDEITPVFEGVISKYYNALVNSKFKEELEQKFGKQLFTLAELTLKTFSPEIIEDLQLENKLTSEYVKLSSSAKIMFEGEERNLSQMTPFMESEDRDIRKRAYDAKYNFFKEHEEEFDKIYDELVKVRTKMAKKLGYKNFVEMGYARMQRSDYNAEMVADFRKQVEEYIVPVATKLRERQSKRLGLDKLKYYDENFIFNSGNAKPHGDPEWIVENAKKMYSELSPETDEFFNFMIDNELMDLVSKKGKAGGGYCTELLKYKSPFIFSNFNGTAGDVEVLTHEGGHAFQGYCCRNNQILEYMCPTSESCEIHSMSMEFFTWPWMNLFFEDETDKFKFRHLSEALMFIPYGVTVDEFQHYVYENPEASPEDRKREWREIEKKYLPHRDYEDNEFLEKGTFWYKQMHIFEVPFYYIDYTLAQICAFQFWKKSLENREEAWRDYVKLCKSGGSKPFLDLIKVGNLISPFDSECVKSIIGTIDGWLNNIDDSTM
jgi:M3 family oligoendopeptidase